MELQEVALAAAISTLVLASARCSDAPEQGLIQLPAPQLKGGMSLEEALALRRSVRRFDGAALTREQLGQLAWSVQGVTEARGGLRTAPSAGALYPLEVYLVTAEATWRYLPARHQLEVHRAGDRREALAAAALGQACVREASLNAVITAVFARTTGKYGARGRMYVHMEAGHAAQNLLLQAVALKLGGVPVGAFRDAEVSTALDLPAAHEPLYIIAIGRPRD